MAQQVEILSLNIDTQALLTKLGETKKSIEQLQASQKALQQSGQGTSNQFIQQAAQLKNLQQSYNQQMNVQQQLQAAKQNAVNVADSLNQALAEESLSIAQATANNKQLLTIRNQLNLATDEGREALELINEKINENTEFIRANVSAQEQQRMNIGNYSESIKEALNNLNPFNGGLAGFTARAQEAGGVTPLLTTSFAAIRTGLVGATKAAIAFIATPIGAAIAALAATVAVVVGAFKFMTASMNSTEEGSQKLARATAAISGIFKGFFKVVKPLGEWLGKVFIATLETVGTALDKITSGIANAMEFLGMESAAEGLRGFQKEIKASSQAAVELVKAENDYNAAQRNAGKIQLEYQKRAEKLRQLRDDESKSIAERKKANEDLGRVLQEQSAAELVIANKQLKVANLRIKSEGETKEALDARAEAQERIADINERITGQESEQLANLNSLRKEAADAEKERQEKVAAARQKAVDDAIQKNKDEISLYQAQQGWKKKSLEDELAFEEKMMQKRLAVLAKERKAGKISKEAYEAEKLNITNEFARKQAEATVSEAQRELDLYKKNLEQKKQDDSFFTEQKLQDKITENNALLAKEIEFQQLQKDKGLINQKEYNDAVNALNDANRIKNEEAQKLRDEAAKEKKAIDLENQRIIDEEKFTNDFELQLAQEEQRYQAELKAAEKTGADTTKITAKHNQNTKKIEDSYLNAKLAAYADMFGSISQLLGENTAAGKAAAIAQATMNTFLGISEVWAAKSVLPEPFATISKVANTGVVFASGMAAAKKITGVNISSHAEGGIIPTLRSGTINNGSNILPLSNGDDTLAYVRQGEVILNQDQQRRAGGSMFFRNLGVPGFAGGGIVGGGYSNVSNMSGLKIDYDILAAKIGQEVAKGNAALPAPIVQVDSFTEVQANNNRIVQGASL